MFNDRYGLTQAVIEGRKTVTRRIEGGDKFQERADCADEIFYNEDDDTLDMRYEGIDVFSHKPRYKVGEVVAVAQSYNDVTKEYPHLKTTLFGHDIMGSEPSCRNKMFVRADLMPHRIRITGIRCERLQDISDKDCMKEGIFSDALECNFGLPNAKKTALETILGKSWRAAFASLIDKVSGRGTWARNPWVVVYKFEMVK